MHDIVGGRGKLSRGDDGCGNFIIGDTLVETTGFDRVKVKAICLVCEQIVRLVNTCDSLSLASYLRRRFEKLVNVNGWQKVVMHLI